MEDAPMTWKEGGCHCGAVRYEVLAPEEIEAKECNCSICRKAGYLHLIVPKERFRLLKGADKLTTYTFNTGTAKHHFCSAASRASTCRARSQTDLASMCAASTVAPCALHVSPCSTGSIGKSRWPSSPVRAIASAGALSIAARV